MSEPILPWCPWCFDESCIRGDSTEKDNLSVIFIPPPMSTGPWAHGGFTCMDHQVNMPAAEWALCMTWVAERHGFDESDYGPDVERTNIA